MRKRVAHLIFCCLYCVLAIIACLADFGLLGESFTTRPFVFYTSISNMLCSGFMVVSLVGNLAHRKVGIYPMWKFFFVIMILLTAIVFNLLLNYFNSVVAYFAAYKNALYHLILPVLFVLDWVAFYERGRVKPLYPVLALLIPLGYVVYILLRAWIVTATGITVEVLYPYFFMNVDRLGWPGFLLWMGILLVMLLLLGYGLYVLDRLFSGKQKTHPRT